MTRDGDIIAFENKEDMTESTLYYHWICVPGWEVPTLYAQLKTGEYLCGYQIVSRDTFIANLRRDKDEFNRQLGLINALLFSMKMV